jgi:hypothetical protein
MLIMPIHRMVFTIDQSENMTDKIDEAVKIGENYKES